MSNVTAKVNGVELTEAQVRDALAQIEKAKERIAPAIYVRYNCCTYAYMTAAMAESIAAWVSANPGANVAIGVDGTVFAPTVPDISKLMRLRTFGDGAHS